MNEEDRLEEESERLQKEYEKRRSEKLRGGATDEQINQAYKERKILEQQDPRTDEEFLKKRAEEGPDAGEVAKGVGFEIAAGLATDIATKPLLALPPLYALANFVSGAAANLIAQKLRGETKLSLGEILGSGAVGIIPGSQIETGKTLSRIVGEAASRQRVFLSGAAQGIGSEAIRIGIDEQRLLTAKEAAFAGGTGGLVSQGFMEILNARKPALDYINRVLTKNVGPTGAPEGFGLGSVGAARAPDPKDIPRNTIDSWRTVGRKSQPLNFLFGDKAGWREGRLNLKSWRERGADKNIAEQFLTAQGKGVVFSSEANKQNAFMSRIFGIEGAEQLLNLPKGSQRIFQAHHKTATKAVLTGQEGLIYDSPYYHEIQKVWEDLELTLGNNPDNIIGTLGLVQRDLNSPHSLIHKFLDSKMGPDGTKFWTEDLMKQIVIYDDAGNAIGHKNFDLRLEKTKEQAIIFKEAVDLLKLAHRQFYLAKGVKPGEYLTTEAILDEEIVDSFINKLPPKGGTGQYTTDVISRIAREVAQETDIKPTIPSGSLKQLADEAIADDVRNMIEKAEKIAVTSANGESMVLDLILNFPNLKPKDAIKKWTGNDPLMTTKKSIQLEKELKELTKSGAARQLKELYQRKFGELPSAVTKFDKGADD